MRFVTTLTANYVPGLHALLGSLVKNAGMAIDMTVVLYEPIPETDRAFAESLGIPIEWVPVQELGHFPAPESLTPRMVPNFQKPLIWRLPYKEPMLYLDADILCLRPLTEVQSWRELTVVRKQTTIGRPPDHDPDYLPSGKHVWNAGVFCFEPSEDTLQGIMEQARSYTTPVRYGDQVILNDYFNRLEPHKVTYANLGYNMSTWVSQKKPDVWRRHKVHLLHYAHDAKPWLHSPEFEWQEKFWALWWSYYNEITGREHV